MPLVGKKHFPYTSKGMKDALKLAEKTGQKVRVDKKGLGGMVKKYANGGMAVPEEYSEGYPREGGERSAWSDTGKFLGMDIPEGTANIANILGGMALTGPASAIKSIGRKSLQGMAKNVAAKRLATRAGTRSLSNEILKSGVKAKEAGPHLYNKGMISEGSMGKLSYKSRDLIKQSEKANKAMLKADKSFQSSLKGSEGMTKPSALKKGMPAGSTNRERLDIYGKYDPWRGKVYDKANQELAKLSEMKRNFDMHNVWKRAKVTPSEVGEFSRVSRRAPSEVIPAAIRGETSRRMGSEGYQEGGMLKGKSHKQGGIAANVGNQPIEMEGGEFIVKKDSAKKLGPDILNYINKNGTLPKMNKGGLIPKLVNKGEQSKPGEKSSWFPKGNFLGMNVPGGSSTLLDLLGGMAIGGGLKPGGKLTKETIKKLIKSQKKRIAGSATQEAIPKPAEPSVARLSNGGEINPYLKDYRDAQAIETSKLAELPQPGSEEYEAMRRRRHSKVTSGFGLSSGQSRWRDLQGDKRMAGFGRLAAERKAKAAADQAVGSGSGNISMFGALKAAGDKKAAWKIMQAEQEAGV